MPKQKNKGQENRALLESRLRYHYRCLREDAVEQDLVSIGGLAGQVFERNESWQNCR